MSSNLWRTLIAVLTVVLGAASAIFGCTTPETGPPVCTATWLTPGVMSVVVMVLGAAHLLLKMFSGGVPALVNKVVPVVPAGESGPGTVTASQVNSAEKK